MKNFKCLFFFLIAFSFLGISKVQATNLASGKVIKTKPATANKKRVYLTDGLEKKVWKGTEKKNIFKIDLGSEQTIDSVRIKFKKSNKVKKIKIKYGNTSKASDGAYQGANKKVFAGDWYSVSNLGISARYLKIIMKTKKAPKLHEIVVNEYNLSIYFNPDFKKHIDLNDKSIDVYRLRFPEDEEKKIIEIAKRLKINSPALLAASDYIHDSYTGKDIQTWKLKVKENGKTRITYTKGKGKLKIRNRSSAESNGNVAFALETAPYIVDSYLDKIKIGLPLKNISPEDYIVATNEMFAMKENGDIIKKIIDSVDVKIKQTINGNEITGGGYMRATLVGQGEIIHLLLNWLQPEYWTTVRKEKGYIGLEEAISALIKGEVVEKDKATLKYLSPFQSVTIQSVKMTYHVQYMNGGGYLIPRFCFKLSRGKPFHFKEGDETFYVYVPAFKSNILNFDFSDAKLVHLDSNFEEEQEEEPSPNYDIPADELEEWAQNNADSQAGGPSNESFTGNIANCSWFFFFPGIPSYFYLPSEYNVMWEPMAVIANKLLNSGYQCAWIYGVDDTTIPSLGRYNSGWEGLDEDSDFAYYHGHAVGAVWPPFILPGISSPDGILDPVFMDNKLNGDNEILWIDSCEQMRDGVYQLWAPAMKTGTHMIIGHKTSMANVPFSRVLSLFLYYAIDEGETVKEAVRQAVNDCDDHDKSFAVRILADTEDQMNFDHLNESIGHCENDENPDDDSYYQILFSND